MPKKKSATPARRRKLKRQHLHIRVVGEQLDRWHRAAIRDQRSLSSWVAVTLDRAVEEEK